MKILFLPNWKVHQLDTDVQNIQAPDKQVKGLPYWFFRYFSGPCEVDIIDFQKNNALSFLEKKCNTYLWQGIKAFAKDSDYDVVISHGAQSGLMYSLLRTLTFRKKPVHIIFDIGGMNGARNNKIENTLIGFLLKSNPSIICHSKVIIENYKKTFSNLVKRSRYIPFGVDVDDFSPQLNTGAEDYVLSFGTSKRDYQTLLEAWSDIDTCKKLRLIGYGQSTSLPNVEVIRKVSIAELRMQIANSFFVVIPLPVFNYSYGQMSFLQSMSMGKTVIVTATPSSVEYLHDGKGSFFVKPYDVKDMREKIELLLNNKKLLDQTSSKSRKYVIENFSEKQMAENIEAFIKENLQS
ncbi:glycosyltransferase family 4 protein [Methylotenera sp.]|uniref:glycosyltransferase family 4 protein n=1 Tax=Methylotenera sp. TaxID=2051956 RepID=UPI002730FD6A|nr:glycosyltransferase family 4 protein [Methylotenera sp.]MDP2229623.1 glycosyltransferase family 4 protein [Methylotenera sp.]